MKIIYTKHSEEKFLILKKLGWHLTKRNVTNTIRNPRWKGASRFGQETAMSLLNDKHILRVVFDKEIDIIKIITFHPARRGTYESTL